MAKKTKPAAAQQILSRLRAKPLYLELQAGRSFGLGRPREPQSEGDRHGGVAPTEDHRGAVMDREDEDGDAG